MIGATGTIGGAVADALEEGGHEVLRASRQGDRRVDLSDPASVAALFSSVDDVDGVVCCAASAPLTPLTDGAFASSLQGKLFGQLEVTRQAVDSLRERGSITLTSGAIAPATPGSAGGALVNAGIEAFVSAAVVEMPRGLRLNAVSPGWVRESLAKLGLDPSDGTPVADVARAYVRAVEGTMQGQKITPHLASPAA